MRFMGNVKDILFIDGIHISVYICRGTQNKKPLILYEI